MQLPCNTGSYKTQHAGCVKYFDIFYENRKSETAVEKAASTKLK